MAGDRTKSGTEVISLYADKFGSSLLLLFISVKYFPRAVLAVDKNEDNVIMYKIAWFVWFCQNINVGTF